MTIKIFDCEQNSPEWFKARLGVPTASGFKYVLAKGAGKSRRSYLEKLAREIVTGELAEGFTTVHLERGKAMEEEARQKYRDITGNTTHNVGFILNGRIGWSPDSLIGEDGALEIKTQRGDLLSKTLFKDEFPPEHVVQCQGGLLVGEREWIDICVYWPGMPLFIKRTYRDEVYLKNLVAELEIFLDDLDNLVAKMDREMVQYEYPPVDNGPF